MAVTMFGQGYKGRLVCKTSRQDTASVSSMRLRTSLQQIDPILLVTRPTEATLSIAVRFDQRRGIANHRVACFGWTGAIIGKTVAIKL